MSIREALAMLACKEGVISDDPEFWAAWVVADKFALEGNWREIPLDHRWVLREVEEHSTNRQRLKAYKEKRGMEAA